MSREWFNAKRAGEYLGGRGTRFVRQQVKAGRLRAATIGGRREIVTCAEWCDEFVEAQARPVEVVRRRA